MRIFIGFDGREQKAFDVARGSAEDYGHEVIALRTDRLRASGMLKRPTDTRGGAWDLISGRPQSTEFALTRFFVPLLAHSGLALYVDCDVIFLRDPISILHDFRQYHAVSVVQHPEFVGSQTKMDGQIQKMYPRKFWSSVMLFNCDHEGNRRLTLDALNGWHRDELHAFKWLSDDEVGALPPEANWLVGIQPKPMFPIIAHYTLGTPDMKGHENDEHAELWLERVSQR